jgi:hypothetical protein
MERVAVRPGCGAKGRGVNPLSIFIYYTRNKRKALPVLGILTLAVFGISLTLVLTATIFDGVRAFVSPYYKFIVIEPNYNRRYSQLDSGLRADVRQSEHLAVFAPIQTAYVSGTVLGIQTDYPIFGVSDELMPHMLEATETTLLEGRLPSIREEEVALHDSLMKTRGLHVGDFIGRDVNNDDNLQGKWRVVGVTGGNIVLNLVSLDRLSRGRTPSEVVLIPKTGEMEGLVADLNALESERAIIQTPGYWNQFVERTLSQYETLVTSIKCRHHRGSFTRGRLAQHDLFSTADGRIRRVGRYRFQPRVPDAPRHARSVISHHRRMASGDGAFGGGLSIARCLDLCPARDASFDFEFALADRHPACSRFCLAFFHRNYHVAVVAAGPGGGDRQTRLETRG